MVIQFKQRTSKLPANKTPRKTLLEKDLKDLFFEVHQLRAENSQLKAENKKLRYENDLLILSDVRK